MRAEEEGVVALDQTDRGGATAVAKPVCCRKLDSAILMVKAAKDRS
jgi:hypothetical protein